MKILLVLMLAIVVAIGGTVSPAMGQYDKEFTGDVNSYWDEGGNWDPEDVPIATDSVLIPGTESCLIHNAGNDAVAELVDVAGTLTIEKTRKLTFTEDSAVKPGGLLELFGTLTMNGDLTIEGASSGDAGEVRLHRNPDVSIDSLINGTGEITVDSGNVPGLLNGAGTIDVEIHNNGKVQAGGDFTNILTPLKLTEAVDGSTGAEFWSTYRIRLHFEGGLSGAGDWFTPACNDPGDHDENGFVVAVTSTPCLSANITIPCGGLTVAQVLCTTGELDIGNDTSFCYAAIVVHPGKTAKFNVSACFCP